MIIQKALNEYFYISFFIHKSILIKRIINYLSIILINTSNNYLFFIIRKYITLM